MVVNDLNSLDGFYQRALLLVHPQSEVRAMSERNVVD